MNMRCVVSEQLPSSKTLQSELHISGCDGVTNGSD